MGCGTETTRMGLTWSKSTKETFQQLLCITFLKSKPTEHILHLSRKVQTCPMSERNTQESPFQEKGRAEGSNGQWVGGQAGRHMHRRQMDGKRGDWDILEYNLKHDAHRQLVGRCPPDRHSAPTACSSSSQLCGFGRPPELKSTESLTWKVWVLESTVLAPHECVDGNVAGRGALRKIVLTVHTRVPLIYQSGYRCYGLTSIAGTRLRKCIIIIVSE